MSRQRQANRDCWPGYRLWSTSRTTQQQWAIPVDDTIDPNPHAVRSSQRAELLAAIRALCLIEDKFADDDHDSQHNPSGTREWIIATDSNYLVNAMTDWLPNKWKHNKFRTAKGTTPANIDLFLELDAGITTLEVKHNMRVGFWHVSRKLNAIADRLAKKAAENGSVASRLRSSDQGTETYLVL